MPKAERFTDRRLFATKWPSNLLAWNFKRCGKWSIYNLAMVLATQIAWKWGTPAPKVCLGQSFVAHKSTQMAVLLAFVLCQVARDRLGDSTSLMGDKGTPEAWRELADPTGCLSTGLSTAGVQQVWRKFTPFFLGQLESCKRLFSSCKKKKHFTPPAFALHLVDHVNVNDQQRHHQGLHPPLRPLLEGAAWGYLLAPATWCDHERLGDLSDRAFFFELMRNGRNYFEAKIRHSDEHIYPLFDLTFWPQV